MDSSFGKMPTTSARRLTWGHDWLDRRYPSVRKPEVAREDARRGGPTAHCAAFRAFGHHPSKPSRRGRFPAKRLSERAGSQPMRSGPLSNIAPDRLGWLASCGKRDGNALKVPVFGAVTPPS